MATNIDNTRSNKVRRLGTEPCSPRQTLTKPDKTDIQAQRHALPHFTLQQMATDIDKNGDQNSNSVVETFAYRHDPTNNDKSRQASTKSDSDRAKRAATLAFLPQIEILGNLPLTFLGVEH